MLNTVRPVEAPDEPLISIRQLTTTSADYLPSTHPITLSDKQPANRLGTFLANLKLITTDRWVLHAVSGYNILSQSPTSVVSLTNSSPARATEGANEGVNSVSHFQGCHFCGGSLPGAVHFDSLPFGEGAGDRGVPPSDQLESAEQIPSQGEVQNGGAPHHSLSSPQGRFHDETRSQGRL